MRVVAGDAFASCAGVLHLRRFNRLGFIVVAGKAERSAISVGQNDFSVLRRLMAAVAHFVFEGIVQKRLHQLRLRRLMRIVALQATGAFEGLAYVRFLQAGVFRVVALDAQRRNAFLQVRFKLNLSSLAILVSDVAGIAAHIERRMTAAFFGGVEADFVTGET